MYRRSGGAGAIYIANVQRRSAEQRLHGVRVRRVRRARRLLSVEDHQLQRRRRAGARALGERGRGRRRRGHPAARRRAAHRAPGRARPAPQLTAAQRPAGGPAGEITFVTCSCFP